MNAYIYSDESGVFDKEYFISKVVEEKEPDEEEKQKEDLEFVAGLKMFF